MLLHVKVRLGKFLYGKICKKLDLAKKRTTLRLRKFLSVKMCKSSYLVLYLKV